MNETTRSIESIEALTLRATTHVRDMVTLALEHTANEKALVIYDTENELTHILTAAYRNALPHAEFLDVNIAGKETVIAACDALSPKDLVVLIQSTDFRLNEFRIRIHLFQRGLKVIDHLHLYRNSRDSWGTYIDALAYDPTWYRVVGHALKKKLEGADTLTIETTGATLTVTGGVEEPKLNVGDYTGMKNIGGTFPIGEVFTEGKNFAEMNGSIMVYGFAGTDFLINMYDPFRVDIKEGLIVGWSDNAPESFAHIVELVRTNERALIREIGFGLNRAITREHYLKDITAFERTLGMHFSLGEKHSVFKKPGITIDKTRFHVDLFPVVDRVYADGALIFENGAYTV